MELRQLRYFVAVIENKGVRRAAEAIHVSQPALSRQLQHLEAELGVLLFRRLPGFRELELTSAGEVVLEHARAIDRSLKRLKVEAVANGGTRPHVRVGAIGRSASHLLAPALSSFHAQHPNVSVTVRTCDADPEPQLFAGDIDFAVGLDLAENPLRRQVSTRVLFRDEFIVVSSEETAKRLGRVRALQDIMKEKWVFWLADGIPLTALSRVLAWPGGDLPPSATITESTDVERVLIEAEGRLGVWSKAAFSREPDKFACLYTPKEGLGAPVSLFWLKTQKLGPAAQKLFDLFETVTPLFVRPSLHHHAEILHVFER